MSAVPAPAPAAAADAQQLRRALGAFATGVTVVTVGGHTPRGMTANSFTAVSLDPPLVLVCVKRDAVMHRMLDSAVHYGVSVLGAHQEQVARHFADHSRPAGISQFQTVDWDPGEVTGVPLIRESVAHFECAVWRRFPGGDHTVYLGEVLGLGHRPDRDGLLYLHGRFRDLAPDRREVSA